MGINIVQKLSSLLSRKVGKTLYTKQHGEFEIVISAIKKGGYKHCIQNNMESLKLSPLLLRKVGINIVYQTTLGV